MFNAILREGSGTFQGRRGCRAPGRTDAFRGLVVVAALLLTGPAATAEPAATAPSTDPPAPADRQYLELPPLPAIPPSPGLDERPMLSNTTVVRVSRLQIRGNTVFSEQALLGAPVDPADASAGTIGQFIATRGADGLTLEQLEQVRVAVTLHYVEAGYINSGAVIDDQPINPDPSAGNEIVVQVVEGRLSEVKLVREGTLRWLRDRYVLDRIRRAASAPLDVNRLRDGLELLRQDPRLKRINAELRPGEQPGQANLDVTVEEANPFHLGLLFSNRRPPSVGAERFELLASMDNLLGFGDSVALRYGINQGDLDDWQWAGLDDFDLDYTIPITPADTTITFSLSRSDSTLVEQPFDELDLDTESTRVGVTVRHPVYRTPTSELALFLGVTAQRTETRLLGERIDLSPGSVEGESNVTAVRFGQEYFARSTTEALSLRSTFSFGVDAFESTINAGDVADSQFVSWLAQAQYVRRLGQGHAQLILRASAQLTPDSLLGPEQFAIGGVDTVRGYRENTVVRDNGLSGTVELRLPLIRRRGDDAPILTFAPFVDAGYGFNRDQRPTGEYLVSVGAGLIFTPIDQFNARVYYGRRLNDVSDDSGNLQDLGIHFAVEYRPF